MHRLFRGFALTAVCFLTGCALFTLASKKRSWPEVEGEVAAGVRDRVTVHRDEWGVPHIRAATEADAWYALGFVHAQDRLFQADMSRRVSWGMLAEWFGEDAADFDVFMRALGFRAKAERQVKERASPADRAKLVAYAEGMNDGVASLDALPIEYRLLGLEFEPWTPVDSLAQVFAMSWTLASNPETELAALMLADRVDVETLDRLYRRYPDDPPVDDYWEGLRTVEVGPLTEAFEAFSGVLGGRPHQAEASNNWVVGPGRSADGAPIVANDPHLVQMVPSLWYVADVRGGPVHVAGVTFPGTPGVIIGHNESVAWGLTNTMADVVDLVVLERKGDLGYVLKGEEKELQRLQIEVPVRGGGTRSGEVYLTDVGPVITELEGTHLVALRWHALEVEDETLAAFSGIDVAGSVDEALAAVDRPMIVSQNLVVADRAGDFAWQVIGSVVRRRNHTGRVPYPGSDPAFGWQGWIDRLPGERDPERGFVASANARPDHPLASAISTDFVPPWRQHRIEGLLEGLPKAIPADMARMQLDAADPFADDLLPRMLEGVAGSTPGAKQCRDLLAEWDHVSASEEVGPAVFAVFQRELLREALVDELGEDDFLLYLGSVTPGRNVLMGEIDAFLQDRPAEVDRALHATCTQIAAEYGSDTSQWTWGRMHPLALKHPFGARSSLLRGWNMEEVPWFGSGSTIAAAGWSWSHRGPLKATWIQSMRLVMPLSDLGASTLVNPGGQSGHPGSPHYRDGFERFVAGDTVPLWFDDEDVAAHVEHTMVLVPR